MDQTNEIKETLTTLIPLMDNVDDVIILGIGEEHDLMDEWVRLKRRIMEQLAVNYLSNDDTKRLA